MTINRAIAYDHSLTNFARVVFLLLIALPNMSNLARGQGYPVGQPAVGNSTNLLAFSNASVDASVMPGTGSICAKIAQAASIASSAGIAIIDARGFTGNQTCSPLDAASTFNNWPTGGVLLLGNVTITLGSLKTVSSLTQVNCTNVNPSVCTRRFERPDGNPIRRWAGGREHFAVARYLPSASLTAFSARL